MRQHGGEQSGLVTLTFDLLDLSVLDLGPMYATDRQTYVRKTDVRQHHRLMPRLLGAGA